MFGENWCQDLKSRVTASREKYEKVVCTSTGKVKEDEEILDLYVSARETMSLTYIK
jgi:hypothetical protein